MSGCCFLFLPFPPMTSPPPCRHLKSLPSGQLHSYGSQGCGELRGAQLWPLERR
jgi:hypothetical protein